MRVEYVQEYSRELCRENRSKLFIFGDNVQRRGLGGQACIRGEPNAHGIRTKLRPAMTPGSFFSDDHYEDNVGMIAEDFRKLKFCSDIVLPANGLGTGRAELAYWAPRTFKFLEFQLTALLLHRKIS
jgi:hypothetical protein